VSVQPEGSVVITRVFDVPRERIFEAWTRAEHLEKWFGPKGFAITDCACDARAGGVFRLCMRAPWGGVYWVRGEYREVLAPERLVIACTLDDEQGASRLDEIIHVAFEQSGSRTRVVLNITARGTGAKGPSMLAGMHKGWAQTVDRLDALLHPKTHKEM
jgi:uncharacterized protein YndB with AHSA1/START domain